MEQVAKCKSLETIFRDDKKMLDGPHAVGFDIEKDKAFHIDVEQCGIRKISITSDVDVSVFDLYALFSRIERLLMLFEGAFISLSEIQLSKSDTVDEKILVWPGANVHRGQFCCYDCPDIYFSNEKIRDHALAFYNKYSNSYMCGDDAIIAGIYNNMSVKSLINMDKDEYENYIEHAINVIKWRTKKIE